MLHSLVGGETHKASAVSSKQSDSKTRSVVAAIRAAELQIIFSKVAFSCFHAFFTF